MKDGISILISICTTEENFTKCIESLKSQTYIKNNPRKYEVIINENISENTKTVLNGLSVHFIKSEGINAFIQEAKFDWILLMNSTDMILRTDALEYLYKQKTDIQYFVPKCKPINETQAIPLSLFFEKLLIDTFGAFRQIYPYGIADYITRIEKFTKTKTTQKIITEELTETWLNEDYAKFLDWEKDKITTEQSAYIPFGVNQEEDLFTLYKLVDTIKQEVKIPVQVEETTPEESPAVKALKEIYTEEITPVEEKTPEKIVAEILKEANDTCDNQTEKVNVATNSETSKNSNYPSEYGWNSGKKSIQKIKPGWNPFL